MKCGFLFLPSSGMRVTEISSLRVYSSSFDSFRIEWEVFVFT